MFGVSRRVLTNLAAMVVFAVLVVIAAYLVFVTGVVSADSYMIKVTMPEAGGVLPAQEVTVMGHAVGQVTEVTVAGDDVVIFMKVNATDAVPAEGVVQVLRRSPIGEQAVDIAPPCADEECTRRVSGWTAVSTDGNSRASAPEITAVETIVPSKVPELLENTAKLFSALETEDIATVISETAAAFGGRGEVFRQLGRDLMDLQATLADGIPDFERFIESSDIVLRTLHDHRFDLADTITNAADLTEVLAGDREATESVLDNVAPMLTQLDALVRNERANLQCLTSDLATLNASLLAPNEFDTKYSYVDYSHLTSTPDLASTDPYGLKGRYPTILDAVEAVLGTHTSFFQSGFGLLIEPDTRTGLGWPRVAFISGAPSDEGRTYGHPRATPNSRPGAACESDSLGTGVNAVADNGAPLPATMQARDFAPQVAETGGEPIDPPPLATSDPPGSDLPATGGGLLLAALIAVGGASALRRSS